MGSKWYFGAKPVTVDGIKFDSKNESLRYGFLKLMEQQGAIKDLRCHVKYELFPPIIVEEVKHLKTKDKIVQRVDQKAIVYTPDFVYIKTATGEEVIEDYKGSEKYAAADSKLRMRIFYAIFKKKVRVVEKPTEAV